MQITNRELTLMASGAFVMMAGALLLTTARLSEPEPPPALPADQVVVRPVVERTGGSRVDPRGPLSVRLTTSAEYVLVTCDLFKAQRSVTASEAWFSTLPVGDCALSIDGSRPYGPVYPGDNLRCGVRDNVATCTGGLATSRAGTVTITSDVEATLRIDDEEIGALPVKRRRLRVGQRALRVDYPDGRHSNYRLVIEPDQVVKVHFPAPAGHTEASQEIAQPRPLPAVARPTPRAAPRVASPPPPAPEPVDDARPTETRQAASSPPAVEGDPADGEDPEPVHATTTRSSGASTARGARASTIAPSVTTP